MHNKLKHTAAILAGVVGSSAAIAADFGALAEKTLKTFSRPYFGVGKPLEESAQTPDGFARQPVQFAAQQVLLAQGLRARYLTRRAADATDQMVFWPTDAAPTHLITCVEEFERQIIGQFPSGVDKFNPSVQRITLATGAVETVLRGMAGCDGLRRTPWNTIVASEETSDGQVYEILNPLAMTDLTLADRGTSALFDRDGNNVTNTRFKVALRDALPTMAWEGLALTADGVVYAGDELRPGSYADSSGSRDTDGGAIFKFVPTTPHAGGPVTDLDNSPLRSGAVHALQVSCRDGGQQSGQGCEVGIGAWLAVSAVNARVDANDVGATGYYRPEDMESDPKYTGPGLRFCWMNTESASAASYGEVMCAIDKEPLTASATQQTVETNRLLEGDTDLNQPDNLAFQPGSGNVYVIEDNDNGDVFACLPDGADRDIKSDGCVKILSVVDDSAEPTGFIFSADGSKAYVSIQHSNDPDDGSMDLDDYGTDDVLVITGFKPVAP